MASYYHKIIDKLSHTNIKDTLPYSVDRYKNNYVKLYSHENTQIYDIVQILELIFHINIYEYKRLVDEYDVSHMYKNVENKNIENFIEYYDSLFKQEYTHDPIENTLSFDFKDIKTFTRYKNIYKNIKILI